MSENETYQMRAKLAAKKNQIRDKIKGIVKTGTNKMQNYKYAEEAEVVKEVRQAMSEVGVDFSVSATDCILTHEIPTKSGSMKHFILKMVCALTDTETGYSEASPWIGSAADSGDKSICKAYTSGCKYFLMKTFLLPTGDDLESFDMDTPPDEKKNGNGKPPAAQQKQPPKVPPTATGNPIVEKAWEAFTGAYWDQLPDGFEWDVAKFIEAIKGRFKGKLPTLETSIPKILETVPPLECWKAVKAA